MLLISRDKSLSRLFRSFVIAVLAVKIVIASTFSSEYQNSLFIPFVSHFVNNFQNPWDFFHSLGEYSIFPYSPVMLYILTPFQGLFELFSIDSILLQNLLFKLPTISSDLLILYLLLQLFPTRRKGVFAFYFISPIVIYSAYMHSQLDLIPTALLFLSIYLLTKNKLIFAAIVYGLTIGTKHHTLIALPLILVFLYKNYSFKDLTYFVAIFVSVFLAAVSPFLSSHGFFYLVYNNPKQTLIYDSFILIGELKLYLPLLLAGILYLRFFAYHKINKDLFFAYLALLFALFIILVSPAPGWYLWVVPFMSIFFIKYYKPFEFGALLSGLLSCFYLIYFIFFYIPDYPDLIFLRLPLDFKAHNNMLQNIAFTVLEVILLGVIYTIFKLGVKSNLVYRKEQAFVIGISGDSGAGKTSLLKDLEHLIVDNLIPIEGDDDHRWERGDMNWKDITHLDPKANYLHRQAKNILALKSGQSVLRINYNHDTGKFTGVRQIKSDNIIILSGLHTLYLPIMRKVIDLKIYLDPDDQVKKHWKIIRDISERGHNREEILEQIEKRDPDSSKYIQPQKEFADLVIRYFALKAFEVGDISSNPPLGLDITIDSSINLDKIIRELNENEIGYSHDYSKDLKTQQLSIYQPPKKELIETLASELIENIDEVVDNPKWLGGYRGFVQIFIILFTSEKMKEKNNEQRV